MALGNVLSNFWKSLVGGLGQSTQNAANNFVNNASGQSGNTPVQPKPMGFNLNPSTISISQGDVQNVGNGLLNTIKKYGTSYLANSNFGQNPIQGAGLTFAQSLFGGQNQQPTNTQAGVNGTPLSGTMQDTLGNNTANYQSGIFSLGGPTQLGTNGSGNSSTSPGAGLNDLPQLGANSYTTPEGQSYLNSLNGYQNQIMKFYSEADETHNHELSQINAEMQNVKNKQEQENIYQAEAARQSGISTGLAFLTPQLYQNAIKNTIDTGIQKIADITVKQNGLILDADKASLQEKRTILGQLKDLQTEKFNATRTMKEDFMKQKQFEDEQHQTIIKNNLPAIYDQIQKLPPAEQGAFIAQAAQRLGVPISELTSSYRNFNQDENAAVAKVYQSIAEKISSTNPALAIEIAQKSLTPEGRKELMNSPFFKAASALGSLNGVYGTPPKNISETTPDAVRQAIFGQESGGNYKAVNKDSGALGKYQIMPQYWFDKIGLNPNSQADKQKFLNSPGLQDTLFNFILNDASAKYDGDLNKIIASYYGGDLGARNVGTAQGDIQGAIKNGVPTGYPSVNQYVQQVLNRLGGQQGTQQQSQAAALASAKQNIAALGGTKFSVGQIASINNPATLWTKAVSVLPSAEAKKDATGAFAMTLAAAKLKELRSVVGESNFGLLAKNQQSLKQLYGGTNGQQVSRLVTEITSLLQQNRSDITGAAWGSKEDKEYLMKLPNQRDSQAAYFGKLEGLLDSAYINARSTVGQVIGGEEIFDSLYGNQFKLDSLGNGTKQPLSNIFGL